MRYNYPKEELKRPGSAGRRIVINGWVVGTWKRTIKNDTVIVNCKPFSKLSDEEKGALAVAVNRYREYLGKAAKLA